LRIWDVSAARTQTDPPVSKACLPNGMILGVNVLETDGHGEPGVAWLGADGEIGRHACPGCSLLGESAGATLGRLISRACEAHAQRISPEDMLARYAITIDAHSSKEPPAGGCG
jgi:hypothetical protein